MILPVNVKTIDVAAGVLINADGQILIAQRTYPAKYAGQWEFPGGKLEAAENAEEALKRELHEELGITVTAARPLIQLEHCYPEFTVRLHVFSVSSWQGMPHSREGQPLRWVSLQELKGLPLLAADAPIISALALSAHYIISPEQIPVAELNSRVAKFS